MENTTAFEKVDLVSLFPEELEELMIKIGEPKFRAKQIFTQLHRGLTPAEMTNVGKKVAAKLDEVSFCSFLSVSSMSNFATELEPEEQELVLLERVYRMRRVEVSRNGEHKKRELFSSSQLFD